MIELLVRTALDEEQPIHTRVAAADKVLDRALGRPMQSVEWDVLARRRLDEMTLEQLEALRAQADRRSSE
jgi:hypothetical protein